jgi:hypothetical protein
MSLRSICRFAYSSSSGKCSLANSCSMALDSKCPMAASGGALGKAMLAASGCGQPMVDIEDLHKVGTKRLPRSASPPGFLKNRTRETRAREASRSVRPATPPPIQSGGLSIIRLSVALPPSGGLKG